MISMRSLTRSTGHSPASSADVGQTREPARPPRRAGSSVIQDHASDLAEASDDGALHKLWYTSVTAAPEDVPAEIDRRLGLLKADSTVPFAVLDPDGKAVGMTTYMNIDHPNQRLEIGSICEAVRDKWPACQSVSQTFEGIREWRNAGSLQIGSRPRWRWGRQDDPRDRSEASAGSESGERMEASGGRRDGRCVFPWRQARGATEAEVEEFHAKIGGLAVEIDFLSEGPRR